MNAAGEPEGSGSCDIKDVLFLIAAVWEEEAEKSYYSCFPEDMGGIGAGAGSGDEWSEEDYEEEVQQEEEFEAWRPFTGPPCLKRKDALHLVYR